jgi:hypothetical protein
MSLAQLRNSMGSSLQKLKQSAEQVKEKDTRFWSPTFDKEKGTGSAVIRFLPAPQGEELPQVKVYSHAFSGPTGKWYVENSLSTIGKRDGVGRVNYLLWNSGIESDKEIGKKQKRKVSYYSNILVINDAGNPENNGKVFLYKYGPQIAEILESAMFPKDETVDTPINPFDPWEGADFAFRIYGKKMPDSRTGQPILVPSYEKSSFKAPSSIGDDDVIEGFWKQCHSLAAFIAPDQFKSEEELNKRLFEVLGPTVGSGIQTVEGWGNKSSAESTENRTAPKSQPKPAKVEEEFDDIPDFDQDPPKAASPAAKPAEKKTEESSDLEFLKSLMD